MKSLVLAACVGSVAAVVVPQLPPPHYAVGDSSDCCCTKESRTPYSIYVQTGQQSSNGYSTAIAGIAPADFVLTEVIVSYDQYVSSSAPQIVRVIANGQVVCATQCNISGGTTGARFAHGVVIPAGHQVVVQAVPGGIPVTLAGYLR